MFSGDSQPPPTHTFFFIYNYPDYSVYCIPVRRASRWGKSSVALLQKIIATIKRGWKTTALCFFTSYYFTMNGFVWHVSSAAFYRGVDEYSGNATRIQFTAFSWAFWFPDLFCSCASERSRSSELCISLPSPLSALDEWLHYFILLVWKGVK